MKTIKKLFAAITMISLCASCSNDETINGDNNNSVKFSASIEHAIKTRAGESTPYTGALTLWNGSVKGGVSADYTYSNNTWSANPPLFWDNLSADGSGLYTFYATANHSTLNDGATGGAVAADQSANDGYAKADLLAAYAESTKRNQTLSFNLKHMMAQFTVVLNNTTDANAAFTTDQLHGATVAAKSLHADYAATWGATASITSGTAADKLTDITLCPDAANASALTGLIYRAIVPAGQTLGNVQINIDGKPYTININHAINAGENTVQTLNVAKTGISLGAVSVTNWVENNLGDAALAINVTGTNSGTDATQLTDMHLWKRGSSIESDQQSALVYKKTAGVWTFDAASNSGKTPFYLDDVAASDQFYASAVNTDANGNAIRDAQTKIPDILFAGPASVSHTTGGGALNLEFSHALAQLSIVVKAGSTFPTGVSLSGAKISTPGMIQNVSGGIYNADGSLVLVASGIAAPYSDLVTTYDATKKQAELTAIVVPQTLAAGSKFVVTLANGNAYTAALTNEVNLQAAQNNALTLTLNPTAAKVAAVTVADWGTGADAAADATVDGVTVSAETLNGISEAGNLVIVAEGAQYGTGNYPIAYANGVASVNTASTNYQPILWDNLLQYASGTTLNSYSYKALYLPTNGGEGNQEKDYLQTEEATAATPWGITPAFNLKHVMGKLIVKLQSDGTYTSDQLKAATLAFTSAKYVSGHAATELTFVNAARTVTMNNASSTADAFGTYTAIVCPQTIDKLIVTINGKAYTLTRSIVLAANNANTLTLKIVKSTAGVNVNVTGWTTTEIGSSDLGIDN